MTTSSKNDVKNASKMKMGEKIKRILSSLNRS